MSEDRLVMKTEGSQISKHSLVIGTRGSELALAQATLVREALHTAHPGLEVETRIIQTTGDKRLDLRLSAPESGGEKVPKGLFTKELEAALLAGEVDIAVHSLKDLPTEMAPELVWAASLPREAVEDVLVTKAPSDGSAHLNVLDPGALVATSSVRRARMLAFYRPDLALEDIRGNVPTRLRKLAESETMAGTVLAYAGLHRLGLITAGGGRLVGPEGLELYGTVLPARTFMPAVGQGAIGLQARKNDAQTLERLAAINDADTYARALAERAFLRALGGSCQTPVGVHSWIYGDGGSAERTLNLHGMVFPEQAGAPPFRGGLFAAMRDAESLGLRLAQEALAALRGS